MVLGFGNIRAIVGHMHPGVEEKIVQARLKYLHRLDFPFKVEDVGTGGRVHYDVDALLRIVAVFELLAAGIAPNQAASLVQGSWAAMSLALARGWVRRDGGGAPVVAMVRTDGLSAADGGILTGGELEARIWTTLSGTDDRRITLVETRRVARSLEGALTEGLKLVEARRTMVAIDAAADVAMRLPVAATGT